MSNQDELYNVLTKVIKDCVSSDLLADVEDKITNIEDDIGERVSSYMYDVDFGEYIDTSTIDDAVDYYLRHDHRIAEEIESYLDSNLTNILVDYFASDSGKAMILSAIVSGLTKNDTTSKTQL